ncbi:HAD family hydrolase [Catenuloplanes sp. NPDC051500]|uniref:HAD family hydrolase n=1 Tax=Catenuloplanes sp. NPDC051500 TaxID=3363959 RepID=UPI00378CCA6B
MGVNTENIDVLVVDYGGVLTNPLMETYGAFAKRTGIPVPALVGAFVAATRQYGETPMAALEVAKITEEEMVGRLLEHLPPGTEDGLGGRPFGELWFAGRRPNSELIAYLKELSAEGVRLGMLTNNVREWEHRWRAQVPVDLFETIVNSADEKIRKPDPEIYRILLDRLKTEPERVLFVDDDDDNCAAARELGIQVIQFEGTAQAIAAVDIALERTTP